jgi:hypothetical protein
MKKTRIVYVHAWESVNVTMAFPARHIDVGSGGFEWYANPLDASKAFKEGVHVRFKDDPANTADFLFEITVPLALTSAHITYRIDKNLHGLCVTAKTRRIGENVLTYWRRNKFKMGGAKRPARAA